MSRADTKNAHIRQETSRREAPDVVANEAQQLLDNPAFKRGIEAVRNDALRMIENLAQDGRPETDELERELCRTIRTAGAMKRALVKAAAGQRLREADFKPHIVKGDDDG